MTAVTSWGTARPPSSCHRSIEQRLIPEPRPFCLHSLPTSPMLAHYPWGPTIISALFSNPRESWVETDSSGEVSGSGDWSARDQHGVGQSALGLLGATTWHQKAKELATSWGLPPPSPPRQSPGVRAIQSACCSCNSDFLLPEDPGASAQRAEAAGESALQLSSASLSCCP